MSVGANPPVIPAFQRDVEGTRDILDQAGHGGVQMYLVVECLLAIMSVSLYDVQRLKQLAEWYGPVYAAAEQLIASGNAHPGGKISLNAAGQVFLRKAVDVMTASGKPIPSEVKSVIDLLLSPQALNGGVDVSQSAARALAVWCQEGLTLVVPQEYSPRYLQGNISIATETHKSDRDRVFSIIGQFGSI